MDFEQFFVSAFRCDLLQLKGWEHNRLMSNFGLFLFFAQIYLIFGM